MGREKRDYTGSGKLEKADYEGKRVNRGFFVSPNRIHLLFALQSNMCFFYFFFFIKTAVGLGRYVLPDDKSPNRNERI